MNMEHMILTAVLINDCKEVCTKEVKIELWKSIKDKIKIQIVREMINEN